MIGAFPVYAFAPNSAPAKTGRNGLLPMTSDPSGKNNPLPFFVYGTLRPGEINYRHLLAGRTVSEIPARITGRLYQVREEDYPYVLEGDGLVQGEVIEIQPDLYNATLRTIDGLEDYWPEDEAASLYLRRPIETFLENGQNLTAWVYLWNSPERPGIFLPHGDFRRRSESIG